jgi:hypothetical protein
VCWDGALILQGCRLPARVEARAICVVTPSRTPPMWHLLCLVAGAAFGSNGEDAHAGGRERDGGSGCGVRESGGRDEWWVAGGG